MKERDELVENFKYLDNLSEHNLGLFKKWLAKSRNGHDRMADAEGEPAMTKAFKHLDRRRKDLSILR